MATVDELIRQLETGNAYERRDAAELLGQLGDPQAIPALLRTLQDEDEELFVRERAAHSIGQIGDLNAVSGLVDASGGRPFDINKPILQAIGEILGRTSPDDDHSRKIFSDTVDWLIQQIAQYGKSEANSERDAAAVEALGKSRDPNAIPVLVEHLLNDDRPEVATDAAFALRHFNDPQVIHALTEVATKKNISVNVREAAVRSLGNIGNPNAVDTLISILEDSSDEDTVRSDAALALGRIGDPKAIEPLIRTLKDEWKWRRSRPREAIAEALGAFRDPRAIDALIEALGSDFDTALAAADSLMKLRDRRAVEPLISILDSGIKNAHKREFAAQILGVLGDPRAIPALVKALHDNSKLMRQYASESLLSFVPTHPDAILRQPPDDRHRLGRQIQDSERDELLQKICK